MKIAPLVQNGLALEHSLFFHFTWKISCLFFSKSSLFCTYWHAKRLNKKMFCLCCDYAEVSLHVPNIAWRTFVASWTECWLHNFPHYMCSHFGVFKRDFMWTTKLNSYPQPNCDSFLGEREMKMNFAYLDMMSSCRV